MDIIYTKKSKELAKSIAKELSTSAFPSNVRYFNNGEMSVSVSKSSYEAIVVASTVNNEDWIELFLLLDALRDAKKIVLCMPYMGYSRQDTRIQNESFGAGLFPRLLETANIYHCIIVDNHREPMMRISTTHLNVQKIFGIDIISKYDPKQIVIVSPDIGGALRAESIAKSLKCDFAICNKTKDVFGEIKKVEIIGNVKNKACVLVDDIIDSGATICRAVDSLLKFGCKGIVTYATHGVFSDGSVERLKKSDIEEIVFTDSVYNEFDYLTKFRKLSIASLIAEAIRCIL